MLVLGRAPPGSLWKKASGPGGAGWGEGASPAGKWAPLDAVAPRSPWERSPRCPPDLAQSAAARGAASTPARFTRGTVLLLLGISRCSVSPVSVSPDCQGFAESSPKSMQQAPGAQWRPVVGILFITCALLCQERALAHTQSWAHGVWEGWGSLNPICDYSFWGRPAPKLQALNAGHIEVRLFGRIAATLRFAMLALLDGIWWNLYLVWGRHQGRASRGHPRISYWK